MGQRLWRCIPASKIEIEALKFTREHVWNILLMSVAAVPLLGLMVYAELPKTRSAADLAVADRCMDWSHQNPAAQGEGGPELAARCNQYFLIRSEKNAEEDIHRWEARTARR